MQLTKKELLNEKELSIKTLGGRSKLKFIFEPQEIIIINSGETRTKFTWSDLDAVCDYCRSFGYKKKTKEYNPMDKGGFPQGYPRHRDTLSLVALAHFMADLHPYDGFIIS